jgi:integrase
MLSVASSCAASLRRWSRARVEPQEVVPWTPDEAGQLGKGVGLVMGSPKTARSRRTLPLPRVLVDTLTEPRAEQCCEREAAGGRRGTVPGLVFTTTRGTRIEPRNPNRFLDEVVAAVGC